MKILAVNGSPNKQGNTITSLQKVLQELEKENFKTEIITIGNKNIRGCIACNKCRSNLDRLCSINDEANDFFSKLFEADALLIGSPVYFSGINGTLKSFLDRAFYVASANGGLMRHKVGAALVALRRSGGTLSVDQITKYFSISEMPIVSSNYWNVLHGLTPGEVLKDTEGLQIAKVLGQNMAWLLKLIQFGKDNIKAPEANEKIYTNFIN